MVVRLWAAFSPPLASTFGISCCDVTTAETGDRATCDVWLREQVAHIHHRGLVRPLEHGFRGLDFCSRAAQDTAHHLRCVPSRFDRMLGRGRSRGHKRVQSVSTNLCSRLNAPGRTDGHCFSCQSPHFCQPLHHFHSAQFGCPQVPGSDFTLQEGTKFTPSQTVPLLQFVAQGTLQPLCRGFCV